MENAPQNVYIRIYIHTKRPLRSLYIDLYSFERGSFIKPSTFRGRFKKHPLKSVYTDLYTIQTVCVRNPSIFRNAFI